MAKELIYGLHAVESLLTRNAESVERLLVLAKRQDRKLQKILELAKSKRIKVQTVDRDTLDRLTDQTVHQGVAAEVKGVSLLTESDLMAKLEQLDRPAFLLILDGVQDPHNLGACLRSAEAAGVDAVIIPKDKAVGVTATVRKVACGAAESVPIAQVVNLSRTLRALQQQGVWLIGAAGEAEQAYTEVDYQGSIGLVMGAEGAGLRQLTKKHCDYLVKIPMQGVVSSLNVSVATGVLLFEALRQRGGVKP